MLQELLDKVTAISCGESQSPNFLSLIGQESREMTHSAFIAALLDPNGVHCQGTLFLRSFVEIFTPEMAKAIDFDSVKVEVEKSLGEERVDEFDNPIGGRIDIYLEDKDGNVVVIENKIYATDQPKQLARYWYSTRDAKKREVVYLTLDGHHPSPISADDIMSSNFRLCSYSQHVIRWLEGCLGLINNNPMLNTLLEQYIQVIRNITEKYRAAEYIASSYDTMKAAILANSALEIARQKIMVEFMEAIAICMSCDYRYKGLLDGSKLFNDKEGCHLYISDGLIDICIEQRLFVRVRSDNTSSDNHKILTPDGWKQSEGSQTHIWSYVRINGEVLDFINLSTPVRQFLGSKPSEEPSESRLYGNDIVEITCKEIKKMLCEIGCMHLPEDSESNS